MAQILENNFVIIAQIMQIFSIVSGVFLTLSAIFELKRVGEQRAMMGRQGAGKPVAMLLAGAVLLILPSMTSTALLAFWGSASDLAYTSDSSGIASLAPAIIVFVRLIGLGSFIRGVIMLSRAGSEQSQPGIVGKALIHIFAGILCLHVVETMTLLGSILAV